jgi:hypothetical protein
MLATLPKIKIREVVIQPKSLIFTVVRIEF